MEEKKEIYILKDNMEFNNSASGVYLNNFPKFNESLSMIKSKKFGYSNSYEIISSEFMMMLSFEIQFKKVFFQMQVIEFLSMNKIEIAREFKLPKNFTVPNSPFEKSALKFDNDKIKLIFEKQKSTHHIHVVFDDDKFSKCDIDLTLIEGKTEGCLFVDSMLLPNEFSTHFHKLGMATSGYAKLGSLFFNFSTKKNIGNFNLSQNVFPKKHLQMSCSASGLNDKNSFGFTFVIDETSSHSNALTVNDKLRQIGQVTAVYNENDLDEKWKFESGEDLSIEMLPIAISQFERKSFLSKCLIIRIYGYFSGKMKNNENEIIDVSDIYSFVDILNFN